MTAQPQEYLSQAGTVRASVLVHMMLRVFKTTHGTVGNGTLLAARPMPMTPTSI